MPQLSKLRKPKLHAREDEWKYILEVTITGDDIISKQRFFTLSLCLNPKRPSRNESWNRIISNYGFTRCSVRVVTESAFSIGVARIPSLHLDGTSVGSFLASIRCCK